MAESQWDISTFGDVGGGKAKWSAGVATTGGNVICIPRDASKVLLIDPANLTTELFGDLGPGIIDFVAECRVCSVHLSCLLCFMVALAFSLDVLGRCVGCFASYASLVCTCLLARYCAYV